MRYLILVVLMLPQIAYAKHFSISLFDLQKEFEQRLVSPAKCDLTNYRRMQEIIRSVGIWAQFQRSLQSINQMNGVRTNSTVQDMIDADITTQEAFEELRSWRDKTCISK